MQYPIPYAYTVGAQQDQASTYLKPMAAFIAGGAAALTLSSIIYLIMLRRQRSTKP